MEYEVATKILYNIKNIFRVERLIFYHISLREERVKQKCFTTMNWIVPFRVLTNKLSAAYHINANEENKVD